MDLIKAVSYTAAIQSMDKWLAQKVHTPFKLLIYYKDDLQINIIYYVLDLLALKTI